GTYLIQADDEQMLVTWVNRSTRTLTVERGYNGTTAVSHDPDAPVYFATDQRGLPRVVNGSTDVGAFQTQATTQVLPAVQFGAATFAAVESDGSATITVTLSAAAGPGGATVAYSTRDGPAHAPGKYTATSGTLTFAAGQTSQTFTIPLVNEDGV